MLPGMKMLTVSVLFHFYERLTELESQNSLKNDSWHLPNVAVLANIKRCQSAELLLWPSLWPPFLILLSHNPLEYRIHKCLWPADTSKQELVTREQENDRERNHGNRESLLIERNQERNREQSLTYVKWGMLIPMSITIACRKVSTS